MPFPILKVGQPVPKQQIPKPEPQRPSWEKKLPVQKSRLKDIYYSLIADANFIANIPIGTEKIQTIQSEFNDLSKSLEETRPKKPAAPAVPGETPKTEEKLGLPVHKPIDVHPTMFANYKFGLKPKNLEDIERMTIGGLPLDLVKLGWLNHVYADYLQGLDLLGPEFRPRFLDMLNLGDKDTPEGSRKEVYRNPNEAAREPGPQETFVEHAEALRRFRQNFGEYIARILNNSADRRRKGPERKVAFPGTPGINPDDQNAPMELTGAPSLSQVAEIYYKYLGNDDWQPMVQLAKEVGKTMFENNVNPQAELAKVVGDRNPPPDYFPMDHDFGMEGQEIYESAKKLFLAGSTPAHDQVMFLDLTSMVSNELFMNRRTGEITPQAMSLLSRIDQHAKRSMPPRRMAKLALITQSPIKDASKGSGAASDIDFIKTLEMPKPSYEEVMASTIPDWIRAIFYPRAGAYKAIRGGKEVPMYAPTAGNKFVPTNELTVFAREAARYCYGFGSNALRAFLAKVTADAVKGASAGILPAGGESLDLDKILAYMRATYVENMFASTGGAEGRQLKEMFVVLDAKQERPAEMTNPPEIVALIENYKKAANVGSRIESISGMNLKQLKQVVEEFGLDPNADLGYPPTRFQGMPPSVKPWDEITEADMEDKKGPDGKVIEGVRSKVKRTLAAKKGNIILMTGPGGMGKSTTAAVLADLLGYGFMMWNMCKSQDMWVGETEKNISAAFKFVKQLKDYVVLLDEVDYCLSGTGGPTAAPGGSVGTKSVAGEFRAQWNSLASAAPKNNLIIISTSNYPERMAEPDIRRLGRSLTIKQDYVTDKEQIASLVRNAINEMANDPSFGYFEALLPAFATAMHREAMRERPYSNDEFRRLFSSYVTWARNTVITNKGLPQDCAWKPAILERIIQASDRQSQNRPFRMIPPDMAFVESVCTGKAPVGPKPGEIKEPGIEEIAPAPIQTQAPKSPLAKDVNVKDVRRQDEGYLLPPAEGSVKKEIKTAALESRPTIKLLAIAENEIDQAYGLKYVRAMDENTGMLFKFQSPKVLNFWMSEVYIPLEIAFIDNKNEIVKTERMIPMSLRTVSSGRPCTMALEVPAGTLEKIGCGVGKKVLVDSENKTLSFE